MRSKMTHMQLEQVAELGQLAIQVLVHGVKALLKLLRRELADGVVRRVVVHVREEDRLREGRLDVFTRATVAMSACANLNE
jgi:hypothetical protein